MSENLIFRAGKNALPLIRRQGLKPEMVKIIAGAAGGPKWLVLSRLDRAIFSSWIKHRTEPLFLIGSSIGAWRFTAMSRSNPLKAQQEFETSYINQRYSTNPGPEEVTFESIKILDDFLDEEGVDEILSHPYLRLNFMAVRCKGPVSSHNKILLSLGFIAAFLFNMISRKSLGIFFERALFYHPKDLPPFFKTNEFPISKTAISRKNLKKALLASGSIPLVMEGVTNPPRAPEGTYRDGGIIDYHMDIPYGVDENKIILYPHFTDRIIPGWLDKQLPWRKPYLSNLKNVLLVSPSPQFITSLPDQKIPNRNDFKTYRGRDEERIKCWEAVVQKGEILAGEFLDVVANDKIKERVQPL